MQRYYIYKIIHDIIPWLHDGKWVWCVFEIEPLRDTLIIFESQSLSLRLTADVDSLTRWEDDLMGSHDNSVALIFIRAQRESLFPLHVPVSEELVPLFFALDQISSASIPKCRSTSGT